MFIFIVATALLFVIISKVLSKKRSTAQAAFEAAQTRRWHDWPTPVPAKPEEASDEVYDALVLDFGIPRDPARPPAKLPVMVRELDL